MLPGGAESGAASQNGRHAGSRRFAPKASHCRPPSVEAGIAACRTPGLRRKFLSAACGHSLLQTPSKQHHARAVTRADRRRRRLSFPSLCAIFAASHAAVFGPRLFRGLVDAHRCLCTACRRQHSRSSSGQRPSLCRARPPSALPSLSRWRLLTRSRSA